MLEMDPAKPVSEFVIAKVKDGSNLGQPGTSGGDNQAFLDLVGLINSQNGVLSQSWVRAPGYWRITAHTFRAFKLRTENSLCGK